MTRPQLVPLILAVNLIAGCAGSQWQMAELMQNGNIGVDEVDASKGLYRVSVLSGIDFGWDGDLRADRERAVAYVLGKKCARTEVVSEVPIELGFHRFTTKPKFKYSMTVLCLDSAKP